MNKSKFLYCNLILEVNSVNIQNHNYLKQYIGLQNIKVTQIKIFKIYIIK